MTHILVVEDDVQFRQMLVQMLRQDGHEVATAVDGAAALKLLETLRPALIMTDILMPNMDGVETITELSRRPDAPPIIAMSGGRRSITPGFTLQSAAMLGVKALLSKPFSRDDLRKAIAEALTPA